jgi:hypothetical protein
MNGLVDHHSVFWYKLLYLKAPLSFGNKRPNGNGSSKTSGLVETKNALPGKWNKILLNRIMVISRAAQKQRAKYIHMAGRAGNEYQ